MKPELAQTVLQAKESSETIWQFLAVLPETQGAQIFYGLLLGGLIGGLSSWLLKWARKEAGCLVNYVFTDDIRYTVLAASGFLGICITALSSGIFVTEQGQFVGWANVLWFGVTNGFGADVAINKGKTNGENKV